MSRTALSWAAAKLDTLEHEVFILLSSKYVQVADERQKEMGLLYTTAETHDLARAIAKWYRAKTTPFRKTRKKRLG